MDVWDHLNQFQFRNGNKNENVEQNSFHGVAKRNAHVDPKLRLLESPKGYGTKGK